jgi:Fe-Mn family superoxide dismutase
MAYTANDYSGLIGLPGFSDGLLNNHFALYQGYVANTNKLAGVLSEFASSDKLTSPEYAEVKRRFGWEWNGMRLHELYFGNLCQGGRPLDSASALSALIIDQFGSVESFVGLLRSTAMMRGIGWVVLFYDEQSGGLLLQWIGEHDTGHLVGLKPLLVMDIFEHAFMLDYGLKRADYIDAFMANLDWQAVAARF